MATVTRVSWLVMGTVFGIGCASALTPYISPSSWFSPAQPSVQPVAERNHEPGRSLEAIVAASAEDVTEPAAAKYQPLAMALTVQNGDTLSDLLSHSGISSNETHAIVESVRSVYDPKKLDIGKTILVQLAKDSNDSDAAVVQSVTLPISVVSTLEVTRTENDSFAVKQIDIPVEHKLAHAGGPIDSSLYQTGIESGIPPALINELINAYSYDVDFQREIKQGDAMDVLFERIQTPDGKDAGHGNVVFAELALGDRTLKVYRYTDKQGSADYYNEKGESVRKALMRTPINGAKITSGFGMRNHPLLGYTRMHRGVDFGAPTGTPIYAAGDGTVEFVGQKNGYGNYVRIKHNGQYASAYAHCSRFASGIAPGRHVKQGQIIAYVGMTGMATGPHLHYEILANNEQVNPSNVKFKTGTVLAGKELLAFRKTMEKVEQKLASMPRGQMDVAMADIAELQAQN